MKLNWKYPEEDQNRDGNNRLGKITCRRKGEHERK
jgi:hypothetical protein